MMVTENSITAQHWPTYNFRSQCYYLYVSLRNKSFMLRKKCCFN